jgi:hypothetical protein
MPAALLGASQQHGHKLKGHSVLAAMSIKKEEMGKTKERG